MTEIDGSDAQWVDQPEEDDPDPQLVEQRMEVDSSGLLPPAPVQGKKQNPPIKKIPKII